MAHTKMDNIIPLAKAIQVHNSQYNKDGADYSVTELLDSPRYILLNQRHGYKVKRHVQESISSLVGTAVHEYIEKMLAKSDLNLRHLITCEERMHIKIAERDISGAYDILIDEKELNDIKTTRVWNVIFGDHLKWTIQQNIYRLMYHKKHHKAIKKLNIIAVFLDWSKYKKMAARDGDKYPPNKVVLYKLKVWPLKKTEEFLKGLVENVKKYEDAPDNKLPYCSPEDTWSRGGSFAVMANGRKKALSLHATKDDAATWIKTYLKSNFAKFTIGQLRIDERVPEKVRCEDWCPIKKYCNQYAQYSLKRGAQERRKRLNKNG